MRWSAWKFVGEKTALETPLASKFAAKASTLNLVFVAMLSRKNLAIWSRGQNCSCH